jgi:hypothetical protein
MVIVLQDGGAQLMAPLGDDDATALQYVLHGGAGVDFKAPRHVDEGVPLLDDDVPHVAAEELHSAGAGVHADVVDGPHVASAMNDNNLRSTV